MNKDEALSLLATQLAEYRAWSHTALQQLLGNPAVKEVRGQSGVMYQIEIEAVWDREPGGPLRVLGAVDDAGWRAYAPLTDDFIMAPDGSFVDE